MVNHVKYFLLVQIPGDGLLFRLCRRIAAMHLRKSVLLPIKCYAR